MNTDEMAEILKWVGEDFGKIPIVDQLVIAAHVAMFIEQIKPIYIKHKMQDETTANFIMKL